MTGEAQRRALVDLLGAPDPEFSAGGLLAAVRGEAERNWRRHVEPLVAAHWPALRAAPAYRKIRIAALDFFACGPYFALILGPRRPLPLRLLTGWAARAGWDGARLSRWLAAGVPLYARMRLASEGRRIALGIAFMGVVDEVLDRALAGLAPAERVERIRAAVRDTDPATGRARPAEEGLVLIAALRAALAEGLSGAEERALDEVLAGCLDWAEEERARLEARPDPAGIAHRGAGIEVGTRGLAWTVERWIGPAERDWMRAVSTFMQMVDDWIDLEDDLARGERTPVAEGVWTLGEIGARFRETSEAIVAIAERNGESYPPYLELLRDSYVHRIRVLARQMASGEAA
ncbi:MAG TPA: hypothetical protein VLA75_06415 [Thermoanaerobaculia bacterium]|nr:hypothetical protein [Thermoanaerobaculia bacterium]